MDVQNLLLKIDDLILYLKTSKEYQLCLKAREKMNENKELIQGILREEWGFEGMVTSDWWTLGEHYKEAKAGNDLKMACGFPERLLEAKEIGAITRQEMEECAKHILEMILKLD